ncbi:MFS-type transporter SLC18B1-like [Arctopsyche grandis]|uniref:MFS-type transporter SLC18B1-like n=1 Tax=Arctopsyche grandis TaxID=121162 RepID=UPI00406D8335
MSSPNIDNSNKNSSIKNEIEEECNSTSSNISTDSKTVNNNKDTASNEEILYDPKSGDIAEQPVKRQSRKTKNSPIKKQSIAPILEADIQEFPEDDCPSQNLIDEESQANLNKIFSERVISEVGDEEDIDSKPKEATASCNVATTSDIRHRKNARSRSWGGPRIGDDNGIDVRLLRERLLRTQPLPQPAAIKNFTRSQKLTLLSLAIVDFMSFCSMSIMAPFFPREAKEKGMTEAVSGFVFSFYALVMFLTSPIFGKIIPSVGTKFLFLTGVFVAGSCNLLFGVLEYIHDYERFTIFCFLIRGFEALGASAYSTASYVFVVHLFPNNISSVLGILETFVGLGMSVGPAIGGLLYSVGGFGLPFYVLGIAMIAIIPINLYLLPAQEDCAIETKSGSLLELIKVPAVVITGLVIVVVSNTWAFLDPTLEPHLRQFDLSPEQVGLVFLLFSALYGIFSPIWGWLADKINHHWCMMVWGLVFCSFGLLLLGPSPFLPFLENSLTLNIIGLSIIGISVALTLLPTFQGVLTSSIEEGGCRDNIATYSVVAGVWSCMYSLGEVIGPSLGGILLKNYGFPICSTVMACLTFFLAIVTFVFFGFRSSPKLASQSDSISDTNGTTDNLTFSNDAYTSDGMNPNSDEYESEANEDRPLLNYAKGTVKGKRQISRQSYGGFDNSKNTHCAKNPIDNTNGVFKSKPTYNMEGVDERFVNIGKLESLLHIQSETSVADERGNSTQIQFKKNRTGLTAKLQNGFAQNFNDFLKYNLDKVRYYNQSRKDDSIEHTLDTDEVTDVRGTVNLTSGGACEV